MLHKFFQNDLQKEFIQHLVSTIPLPIYHTVSDGDYIIKDKFYFYYRSLIRCTSTGIINYQGTVETSNRKKQIATYEIVEQYIFGDELLNATEKVACNCSFYDQQTHAYFGRYLRALRDLKNINVMQMYNCFNYTSVNNITINQFNSKNKHDFEFKLNDTLYQYFLVPISFNTTYTIAIESLCGAKILPILYSNRGPLLNTSTLEYLGDEYNIYDDSGNRTTDSLFKVRNLDTISFAQPIYYELGTEKLTEELESKVFELEKYLNLLIMVPMNRVQTSITILEGKYQTRVIESLPKFPTELSARELDKFTNSQPALLQMADENQYAYNDKLIEYLLENPITGYEEIEGNVKYLQELVMSLLAKDLPKFSVDNTGNLIKSGGELISDFRISNRDFSIGDVSVNKDDLYKEDILFSATYQILNDERKNMIQGEIDSLSYKDYVEDVWNDILRLLVYHLYMDNTNGTKLDINGYLDSDTERFLIKELERRV